MFSRYKKYLYLFIAVLLFASCDNDVLICTGSSSRCYHKKDNCIGLRNCSGEIRKISLEDAQSRGRKPCDICCSTNEFNNLIWYSIIGLIILTWVFIQLIKTNEIQRCNNIRGIVRAINFGKVFPYRTGMSLKEAKWIAKRLHIETTDFENQLYMYGIFGRIPNIDLPRVPNDYIEKINLDLNRFNIVCAITIHIKNFNNNKAMLIDEMTNKFGKPTSMDNEFIIWRKMNLVINVHIQGTITVMDEMLMGH